MVDCAALCLANGTACNVFRWQDKAGLCSYGRVSCNSCPCGGIAREVVLLLPQIPCLLQYDGAEGKIVWVNADLPVKRYTETGMNISFTLLFIYSRNITVVNTPVDLLFAGYDKIAELPSLAEACCPFLAPPVPGLVGNMMLLFKSKVILSGEFYSLQCCSVDLLRREGDRVDEGRPLAA